MIQIVKTGCCGKIFAACSDPIYKKDQDWIRRIEYYQKRGDVVDFLDDAKTLKFETCSCDDPTKHLQLKISNEIVDKLNNRSGFDSWWDMVDHETQNEIIQEISLVLKPYIDNLKP
jgi:hypothetical protein